MPSASDLVRRHQLQVWIHLGLTRRKVHPCREMRIHVGSDFDGLHAHGMAEGHRLRLCAEAEPGS
jgi:hypothetical protein